MVRKPSNRFYEFDQRILTHSTFYSVILGDFVEMDQRRLTDGAEYVREDPLSVIGTEKLIIIYHLLHTFLGKKLYFENH